MVVASRPPVSMPVVDVSMSAATVLHPIRKHRFPSPKLRLSLNDVRHSGSSVFLKHINAATDLEEQVQNVLNLLYDLDSSRPDTRSVTFVLREFDGLAYTTGTELDDDHKEIHFNLGYIKGIGGDIRHEILGVLCHELVHCYQWNARGTCPGGLIEGIADYVRLNAGLGAKHWRREADGNWDGGYQHTGYFLDSLEKRFGAGTVKNINATLRKEEYNEDRLWRHCCGGQTVQELWEHYRKELKQDSDASATDVAPAIPTHPAKHMS